MNYLSVIRSTRALIGSNISANDYLKMSTDGRLSNLQTSIARKFSVSNNKGDELDIVVEDKLEEEFKKE